tara:strand:- start:2467 stop:3057 length:591 start_codon:yes stop_codon:yes gene_type:complete
MLETVKVNDRFRIIPYIVEGKENLSLTSHEILMCRNSIENMKYDSANDRLTNNYSLNLNLDSMYLYSLYWDALLQKPVMFSGAQVMSDNCCRLFSRYYLFTKYRTQHTTNLYAKVDDFEVDKFHLEHTKSKYPFIFWSRDKGTGFFKRLKTARPDIFNDWLVYPNLIELLWENNKQGIMYTNTNTPDIYLKELSFK